MSTKVVKRKKDGRFAKGTSPGPGNALIGKMQRMKRAVLEACSPNAVKEVMQKLRKQALEGDVSAAKVWLHYAVGAPQHLYDPRQGMPSQEAGEERETMTLQEQIGYLRGALWAKEQQLAAEQQATVVIDAEVDE